MIAAFSRSRRSGSWKTVALAIALSASAAFAASDAMAEQPRVATIDINGSGTVTARPDIGHVQSGVVSDADTAAEALAANTASMTNVIKQIKAAGIEAKDIQTSGFSVSPRYERVASKSGGETSQIVGYRVQNNVAVTVRDLDKMGALLDVMVKDGANQVNGISFSVKNAEELKDEARTLAMKDAIRKATIYADAAGIKLGRVLSINEINSGPHPKMMMMARMADASMGEAAPVEAGEASLDIQIQVSFEIKQ